MKNKVVRFNTHLSGVPEGENRVKLEEFFTIDESHDFLDSGSPTSEIIKISINSCSEKS